jgi:uncharacterized repeat protein (TIGR01451 family)
VALAAVAGAVPASADDPSENVTLSQAPEPVTAGKPVAYTTTFASTRVFNNIQLKDPIPSGMSLISATASTGTKCKSTPAAVICKFGFVPADTTISVVVVMNAPSKTGRVTNKVKWTGTTCGYHPCSVAVTRKTTTTVVPLTPNLISEYVLPAGSTVSTGNGTSPQNPMSTKADIPETPLGTGVTINEVDAADSSDACGPAADCFGQISNVTVGSTFTAGTPMQFQFTVDQSQIPYGSLLPMYHDGVLVPDCTGAPGVASPDPCVESRTYVSGTDSVIFTVNTSTNGRWRP